jgi:hypothetical protein
MATGLTVWRLQNGKTNQYKNLLLSARQGRGNALRQVKREESSPPTIPDFCALFWSADFALLTSGSLDISNSLTRTPKGGTWSIYGTAEPP